MKLILGGPGCGKTTHLLSEIDQALADGIEPNRIAFVSFTRKAAHEARDRAALKFKFSKDDLVFFRTLHSMAFAMLGLSPVQIMSDHDWQDFAELMKIKVSTHDDMPVEVTSEQKALNIYALSRLKMQTVHKTCVEYGARIDDAEYFARHIEKWKSYVGKMDFTDMISEFIRRDAGPQLDLLIVDEAQDLSALQWRMVDLLAQKSQRLIIAGDDDQAIFEWAGADINQFLALKGEQLVLPRSYRLSQKIHAQVHKIAKNIGKRFEKNFAYDREGGLVERIDEFKQADLSKSTMFLARNKYLTKKPIAFLREQGYPYVSFGASSIDTTACRALLGWEELRHDRVIDGATANLVMRSLYQKLYTETFKFDESERFTMNAFAKLTGLKEAPSWREALVMSESEREYYRAVNKRGLSLRDRPQISVGTIHSVKGGEADHVVLMTDMSRASHETNLKNPASEARVFYVGASRAREKLYIWGSSRTGYEIPR